MKIRFMWSCSDYVYHEHKFKWCAWICGKIQKVIKGGVGNEEVF